MTVNLFEVYMFLISLAKGFALNSRDSIYVALFAIGIILILLKMINESYTKREIFFLSSIMIIGLISFLIANNTTILFTSAAFFGMKNIDYKRTIKIVFMAHLIAFLSMLLLTYLGIIENNFIIFYRNNQFAKRYDFGYGHPNSAHMEFGMILLLFLYLHKERISIFRIILILFFNHILYTFTYSRTAYIIVIIALLVFIAIEYKGIRKTLMHIFKISYLVLFVLTIVVSLLHSELEIISNLDLLLTGRLRFNKILLTGDNLSLFGREKFSEFVVIDNGFISLLYNGGILSFLWFSYYYQKTINYLFMRSHYKEMALIICFLLFNMTESFLPSISMNTSLLFFGLVIFNQDKDRFLEAKSLKKQKRCSDTFKNNPLLSIWWRLVEKKPIISKNSKTWIRYCSNYEIIQ